MATGQEVWFIEAVERLAAVRAERARNGRPDWQAWPDEDGHWANDPPVGQ
jgi:hypothetical protein